MDDSVLYGTTLNGGFFNKGTLFALDKSGNLTSIYSFKGPPEGATPSGLIMDKDIFYGITIDGGFSNKGTVFKLDKKGTMKVLYSFKVLDGACPTGLIINNGILYGITEHGWHHRTRRNFRLWHGV